MKYAFLTSLLVGGALQYFWFVGLVRSENINYSGDWKYNLANIYLKNHDIARQLMMKLASLCFEKYNLCLSSDTKRPIKWILKEYIRPIITAMRFAWLLFFSSKHVLY